MVRNTPSGVGRGSDVGIGEGVTVGVGSGVPVLVAVGAGVSITVHVGSTVGTADGSTVYVKVETGVSLWRVAAAVTAVEGTTDSVPVGATSAPTERSPRHASATTASNSNADRVRRAGSAVRRELGCDRVVRILRLPQSTAVVVLGGLAIRLRPYGDSS
ncbi:MAG: hypothetical protein ACYC4R_10650 [Anaerolineae bacterium]